MTGLDSLYQTLILEHSKRPLGQGELSDTAAPHASHHELNPSCGDEITLTVACDPETQRVTELKWQGQGCSISTASASVLSQLMAEEPRTLDEVQDLIDAFRKMLQDRGSEPDVELLGDAVAFQGVSKFVMRIKCAMLAWVALEADLKQLRASLDNA